MNKSIKLATLVAFVLIACAEQKEVEQAPKEEVFQRFELLSTTQSGITFGNYIAENNELNIVSYEYLYNGGGVGVGDFNNDGLKDLYFTGTMVPDKLFLNQGGLKFKDQTSQSGINSNLGFKTGVSVVDINNDGWMDVYVARTGKGEPSERENLLYINKGDAVFEEEGAKYGLNSPSHSNHSYFFDYDLDGDLDVYILNHPIDFLNSQEVRVEPDPNGGFRRITGPKTNYDSDQLFRNNGNGTFTDVSKRAGIQNYGYGLSASIGDFNSDGLPDLFVANDYVEPDILYINQGNGTFKDQIDDHFEHMSQNSMGSDYADLNNDGMNDLIVVDMIAEDQKRQKSLMTSMIYDRYQTLMRLGYKSQQMRNVLQLNNGPGNPYSEVGQMASISNTDWSWAPLIVDLDNDGLKDLFVSNGYKKDLTNCDFTIYKSDSLKKSETSNIYDYLNLIPSTAVPNYFFKNKDGILLESMTEEWGANEASFSNGAAFADLDNDGDLDLITNNLDGRAFVYRNKTEEEGKNNFLRMTFDYKKGNAKGIGAKVKVKSNGQWQFSDLKFNRGYFSSVEQAIHFGLGKANKADSVVIQWPDKNITTIVDLAANKEYKLKYDSLDKVRPSEYPVSYYLTKQEESSSLEKLTNLLDYKHVENPYEDFLREPFIPHKLSELGPTIAKGDINGDGMEDLFIGGAINQPSQVFINNGSGFDLKENEVFKVDAQHEDGEAIFFDFDKDGDLDIYVASSGNEYDQGAGYQDRVYVNDGEGNFTKAQGVLPKMGTSSYRTLSFDYDQDGDLDILSAGRIVPGKYPTAPNSYLLKNENGRLINVTDEVFPDLSNMGMITAVEWVDFGDGKNILAISGEWMPIRLFEYDGNFEEIDSKGLNWNGWWNELSFVDIDKDGDLDIVAGNLGLNSKYKASMDRPFSVYAKDFDNNGSIDPILCQYIGETSWPVAQKNTVTKNIPTLQSKLAKYEKYSESTIQDIFTEEELEDALYLEVHTFASSVFINEGNYEFKRMDLPVRAQMAPIYSIAVHDFDADGNSDLFVGGNKIGTEVERGPYDASYGLILLGDGNGGFSSEVSAGIKGQIRDSELIKTSDQTYLLIGRNNESLVALKASL